MNQADEIRNALSVIMDPDLGQDIVSLGFIHDLIISDSGHVSLEIRLTTPACPVKDLFKSQAENALKPLGWITQLTLKMGASTPQNTLLKSAKGLEKVGAIIAVSSCKGGVGKSSVATNLAYQLLLQGARVGLFDADIYGPSLPTMVRLQNDGILMEGQWVLPLEDRGMKLMSFGYLSQDHRGPALLRGPMVSQIINQLLTGTFWGELDYLVIDMPPGTGDIPITLTQLVPITGALIVTTPQQISCVDVVKGIQMFDTLKVPIIGVVENMSTFTCNHCDTEHHIFGSGALEKLTAQFCIANTFQMPIDPTLSQASDSGTPFVIQYPGSTTAQKFDAIAKTTVQETAKLRFGSQNRPQLKYENTTLSVQFPGGEAQPIPSAKLRLSCRCALCIDEWTGAPKLDPASISESIAPTQIQAVGNYAFGVQWSDGHSSLYGDEQLAKISQNAYNHLTQKS